MKMRITFSALFLMTNLYAASPRFDFDNKKVEINLKDTPLSAFLELIAMQSNLKLEAPEGLGGVVSGNFGETTPKEALFKVAVEKGLKFNVEGSTLNVTYKEVVERPARKISEDTDKTESASTPIFDSIPLKYLMAKETPDKLKDFIQTGEKILVNEPANALTFFGSKKSLHSIKQYLDYIDIPPIQIMIEAQIVEMTRRLYRDFGMSFGDLDNTKLTIPSGADGTGVVKTGRGLAPNVSMGIRLGSIAGNILQAKIDAAEQSGEAKIISRPRIATLNGLPAVMNSGVTFSVKTASASDTGSAVVGGVSSIRAGLNLSVTPLKVGQSQVKLMINLTNSEPNNSSAIDGIPSINDNSASATVIIDSGETAIMAGLIKRSHGKTREGVPGLSDIPFLGWLFKSQLEKSDSSELMIMVTPHLIQKSLPNIEVTELTKINEIKTP